MAVEYSDGSETTSDDDIVSEDEGAAVAADAKQSKAFVKELEKEDKEAEQSKRKTRKKQAEQADSPQKKKRKSTP